MFEGKAIIITGGSSGLGKALAERLVTRGANLALIARDEKKLRAVRDDLLKASAAGKKVEIFSCDVSNDTSVTETMKAVVDSVGLPDILINSAGILRESHFDKQPLDTFREVMDINYFGTLNCIKAALPYFKQKGSCRIVNICSMAGLMGVFGYAAYCSSKHAVAGLTHSIRCELKPLNIKVQIVYPHEFDSPMVDDINTYRSKENKMMVSTIPTLALDTVADAVMKGMESDKYEIIPGRIAGIVALMGRLFPSLSRWVVDSRISKFYLGASNK